MKRDKSAYNSVPKHWRDFKLKVCNKQFCLTKLFRWHLPEFWSSLWQLSNTPTLAGFSDKWSPWWQWSYLSRYFVPAINRRVLLPNGRVAHPCGQWVVNLEAVTHAAGSVLESAVERRLHPVKIHVILSA